MILQWYFVSIVSDTLETVNILNKNLDKIRDWAEHWKTVFHPYSTKHIQEVFSKTPQEVFLPNLYFNKLVIEKMQTQKHLGPKLDKKDNKNSWESK